MAWRRCHRFVLANPGLETQQFLLALHRLLAIFQVFYKPADRFRNREVLVVGQLFIPPVLAQARAPNSNQYSILAGCWANAPARLSRIRIGSLAIASGAWQSRQYRRCKMTSTPLVTIPARRGKAAFLERGQSVRVINTHGQQVIDTWAFARHNLTEFMSMEHSRTALARIMPQVGQSMVTNRRRPILTLVEDTSGGIHDTLLAACDRYRYELLGCEGLPRQLHRQPGRGPGGARADSAGNAQPVEPFHEHPGWRRRLGQLRTAGLHAGEIT